MAKVYGERWEVCGDKPLVRGQRKVWRVIDRREEYHGEYALKRILRPKRSTRFQREISAVQKLRHPNVIGLVDPAALTDTSEAARQYLVMPIAEGGDLGRPARIRQYKGAIAEIVEVARQMASALAAAHAAGVVHRDLKPGNVLFTGLEHEIWLSDFGVCLIRDPDDAGVLTLFMAPELKRGMQLDVTPAADVYSMGVLLCFMLSGGTVPVDGSGEVKPEPGRDKGAKALSTLIRQMVCPLEKRLKTMPEVLERLEAVAIAE